MKFLLIAVIINLSTNLYGMTVDGSLSCPQDVKELQELNSSAYPLQAGELSKFFSPPDRPHAYALAVHGLNLRPSKMNDLISVLNKMGIEVLRVSLPGHRGNQQEDLKVTRKIWIDHLLQHYCLLQKKAKGKPLFYLGYSLGGLLGLNLLQLSYGKMSFEKMVLLSPAIKITTPSKLPKFFTWIFPLSMSLPSFGVEGYLADNSISLASYHALYQSIDLFQTLGPKQLTVPTLVMMDPRDELVDFLGIEDYIKDHQLQHWKLLKLRSKPTLDRHIKHLIIDPASLGQKSWQTLELSLKDFLKLPQK